MNISGMFNNAKLSLLSERNAKEVSELCEDLSKNTPYKNIKLKVMDRDNVQIVGKSEEEHSMTIDMDFVNNVQKQVEKTKSFAFSILPQHREWTQEIRGNIDGPVKRAITTETAISSDGKRYMKTTDYENFISGNKFRRVETPQGVTFYRNIDGDFVEMFKN